MKKNMIMLAALLIGLCGCGANKAEETPAPVEEKTAETAEQTEETADAEKKALLVYFSRAGENWEVGVVEKGNTRIAAEYIAETCGADTFEIVPVNPYPSDYMETVNIADEEKKSGARPEISDTVTDWESYDTIILGYPIWHGDLPMIVYNFLESYDFSGKMVYPFVTHGGSGLAGTPERIRSTAAGADVKDGLALTGKTIQNDFDSVKADIDTWLADNGLVK